MCSVWKERRRRQDFCCCSLLCGTPTPPMPTGPILSALLAPAINICHPASLAGVWMTLLSMPNVFLFFFLKFRSRFEQSSKDFCVALNGHHLRGFNVTDEKKRAEQHWFFFLSQTAKLSSEWLLEPSQKAFKIKANLPEGSFQMRALKVKAQGDAADFQNKNTK